MSDLKEAFQKWATLPADQLLKDSGKYRDWLESAVDCTEYFVESAFIAGAEYQKEKMLSEVSAGFQDWCRDQHVANPWKQLRYEEAWQASRLSALKEIEELKKEIEILKGLK